MASATTEPLTPIVEYNVSDAAIEQLRERLSGLTINKPSDYEVVRCGIAEIRDLRGRVEKMRVELKAGALEYGRKVDSEAKRITAMLLEIEEPLKLEKQKVDDEKARVKREKEDAERAKIEAELAAKRAAEEAEAARLKAERDAAEKAERERIAAAQAAENARLESERRKLAAAQAIIDEQNRAAAAKLEAERKVIEAERLRMEREEFERQAKARAEQEARDRLAREAEAKREAEVRAAEERKRLAQMAPDKEKLSVLRSAINDLAQPAVISPEARECLADVNDLLNAAVERIDAFSNA
jgi:chromosome segregation ATPase